MRAWQTCTCALLFIFLVLQLLWVPFYTHYVRCLSHPEDWQHLYIPPSDVDPAKDANAFNGTRKIPRILHQTWKNEIIPEKWKVPYEMCQNVLVKRNNFTYMLWTDAKSREFIANEFPWFLPTFDGYPHVIQRADAIRYFVLYKYGGIYMDLDIGCKRAMDPWLTQYDSVLVKTEPVGFSNDMMASNPGHPFLKFIIDRMPAWAYDTYVSKYATVFFSTGPMLVNLQFCHFHFATKDKSFSSSGIRIMPGPLYGGDPRTTFVAHFPGSSWHGSDAALIFWIWKHWVYATLIGIVLLGSIICFCCIRKRNDHSYSVIDPNKQV